MMTIGSILEVRVIHLRSVSPCPVFPLTAVVSTYPGEPVASIGGLHEELLLMRRLDGGEGSSPLLAGVSSILPCVLGTEQLVLKAFGFGFGGSLFLG